MDGDQVREQFRAVQDRDAEAQRFGEVRHLRFHRRGADHGRTVGVGTPSILGQDLDPGAFQ